MDDNTQRVDLHISGYGNAPGGDYNSIRIAGRGKLTGDVTCGEFIISGSGEVQGAVSCKKLHINGSGEISGAVKADELKVRGSGEFDADVTCDSLTVSGAMGGKAGVKSKTTKISGLVKIKGDFFADSFNSSGSFEIGGLLSADHIDVNMDWSTSRAREIGGERIFVRAGNKGLSVLRQIFTLGTHIPRLDADSIEGNEVYLENTTAKVVRGANITLADGCDIALVEYTGMLQKSGNAKVGEERKI